MREKGMGVLVVLAALLVSQGILFGDGHYKVLNGPANFYYGHISFVETKAGGQATEIRREGRPLPEAAVVNVPLGPGDTVRTSVDSRCEIQFDTATVIRLDFDTELKIETVLAQSLSSQQQLSNLTLSKGRIYVLYKQYGRTETFQILTGNAALKMKHNTIAMVKVSADKSTDVQVKVGRASVLFGPNEDSLKQQNIDKMKRLIVLGDNQAQPASYIADTDFELWNNDINAKFDDLHKGTSGLPKPVQKLPEAVFYFAQNYGNTFGEWLWDDLYGYVWHPFLNNNIYPWGWQPYFYGQWSSVGDQMFWVPEEPWGWVPYHLGLWQWDKKLGWVWLPGSMFAPAWVDWDFYFGYAGWHPLSLFDWLFADSFYGPYFMNLYGPFGPIYSGLFNGIYPWSLGLPNGPGGTGAGSVPPIQGSITKDQLKDPAKSFYTLPKELKNAYKTVVAAFNRKDPRILESMRQLPSHSVFVNRADLNTAKIQDKAITWDKVSKATETPVAKNAPNALRQPADTRRQAATIFGVNERARISAVAPPVSPVVRRIEPVSVPRSAAEPPGAARTATAPTTVPSSAPALRNAVAPMSGKSPAALSRAGRGAFLDWNPDIRVARELGVHIEYSGRTNQIRCPELRLTSSDRQRPSATVPTLTTGGISYAPATSSQGNGVSSTSSSSNSSQNSSRASGKESSSGSTSSSGGKIKN